MKQAKTLSDRELKRVLAIISASRHPQRNRIAMLLSFYAGLRAKEIAALRVCDVFAEDGSVMSKITLNVDQTKGNNSRSIYINTKLSNALEAYKKCIQLRLPMKPLIESQKRTAFSPNSMCQLMCSIYKSAGIIGASSHSGRRSFITNLANKGVNVRVLMELSGHKNMATTQRYIDVNEDLLKNAVELAI